MQMVLCPHCRYEIGYLDEMAGENMSCPDCGQRFQMPHLSPFIKTPVVGSAATDWREPGQASAAQFDATAYGPPRNPGLAAVLSFLIFGLGQVYNGQIGKGIAIFIGGIVLASMGFMFCLPFIGLAVLWLWSVYDAYDTAEKHNRRLAHAGR